MTEEKLIEHNRVTLRSLLADWNYYYNIPEWQRGPVWSKPKQRGFIRTLIEGNYTSPIVFYPENGIRFVLDGQQRLNAVRTFFDGGLGLYNNNSGRYFKDLSETAKNKFLDYAMSFDTLHGWSLDGIIETYIGIQNLQVQKPAEKQYAYSTTSEIGKFAKKLTLESPFFSTIFIKDAHKGDYSVALYPITMEMRGGLAGMDTPQINSIVKGTAYAVHLTEAMKYRVEDNLLHAAMLYDGVATKARSAIIPIYQSIVFLRLCGYDLDRSAPGALAEWFRSSVEDPNSRIGYVDGVLHNIYRRGSQETFWINNLRAMASSPSLCLGDDSSRQMNRLWSWFYRNAKCVHCGETVALSHFNEHAFSAGDTCTVHRPETVNAD